MLVMNNCEEIHPFLINKTDERFLCSFTTDYSDFHRLITDFSECISIE